MLVSLLGRRQAWPRRGVSDFKAKPHLWGEEHGIFPYFLLSFNEFDSIRICTIG